MDLKTISVNGAQLTYVEQGSGLFVDGVSGKGDYERLPEAVRARFLENARSLQAETISPDYFTEITPQQIRQIQVPTLFLKGEQSPKMFHLIVDRLIQSAQNPREATIPNASHAMYSGNPQAYYEVVAGFLGSKRMAFKTSTSPYSVG